MQAETTPPPPGADSQMVAAHLSQAIKFQTISYGEGVKEKERNAAIAEFRDWMEHTYPYFFEAAPQEQIGESLLFTWRGTNPNLAAGAADGAYGCRARRARHGEGLDARAVLRRHRGWASSGAAARSTTKPR